MKRIFIFLICIIGFIQTIFGQVAVSYYPITSYIGVSTNPDNRIWADFRLETNTNGGNSNMEISPKLNLKRADIFKAYVGLGVNFNVFYGLFNNGQYINGYFVSGGIIVSPFKKVRNLSFIFEISPYVNYTLNDGMIRTNLGIAWHFKKKTKELPLPTGGNKDIE